MTSLTFPTSPASHTARESHAEYSVSTWPWKTALLLFLLFAMASWSWSASQRWYASDSGDVDAMVDRIAEGQINRQAAFALMAVYGIAGLVLPSERSTRLKMLVFYPILVFCGWAVLSTLWSVDR